jgi:CheY-like chemotaxis protein
MESPPQPRVDFATHRFYRSVQHLLEAMRAACLEHFDVVSIEMRGGRLDIAARSWCRTIARMADIRDIVVYEEDLLTRTLLEEWLGDAGYRVRVGNQCDPGVDAPGGLLIVSVYMPKQSGALCLRAIQAAHPGTPLIAISGHFRPGLAAAGSAAQMLSVQQVLAKPLVRTELLEAVRCIIRSQP